MKRFQKPPRILASSGPWYPSEGAKGASSATPGEIPGGAHKSMSLCSLQSLPPPAPSPVPNMLDGLASLPIGAGMVLVRASSYMCAAVATPPPAPRARAIVTRDRRGATNGSQFLNERVLVARGKKHVGQVGTVLSLNSSGWLRVQLDGAPEPVPMRPCNVDVLDDTPAPTCGGGVNATVNAGSKRALPARARMAGEPKAAQTKRAKGGRDGVRGSHGIQAHGRASAESTDIAFDPFETDATDARSASCDSPEPSPARHSDATEDSERSNSPLSLSPDTGSPIAFEDLRDKRVRVRKAPTSGAAERLEEGVVVSKKAGWIQVGDAAIVASVRALSARTRLQRTSVHPAGS